MTDGRAIICAVYFFPHSMRLLTHNTLRNNSAQAKGKGFPLRITVLEVRVDEDISPDDAKLEFVKGMLPTIDWPALVQV